MVDTGGAQRHPADTAVSLAERGRWQWLTADERVAAVRACEKRGLSASQTAGLFGLTPVTVKRWAARH